MLGYALPIPDGKIALFFPAPRTVWGELRGITGLTVLSPTKELDVSDIPLQIHDNIFRFDARALPRIFSGDRAKRMMLWGIIWLAAMNKPAEDILGGLYLLIGLPFFIGLHSVAIKASRAKAFARFKDLFYAPDVKVVYSPRLEALQQHVCTFGAGSALEVLDELGLGHLREFYKRVAWQNRWQIGPPTGAGLLTRRSGPEAGQSQPEA